MNNDFTPIKGEGDGAVDISSLNKKYKYNNLLLL